MLKLRFKFNWIAGNGVTCTKYCYENGIDIEKCTNYDKLNTYRYIASKWNTEKQTHDYMQSFDTFRKAKDYTIKN